MPSTLAAHRPSRALLLTGAATVLSLLFTIPPAVAQSVVSVTGDRALANQQAIHGVDQEVDAENTGIFVSTPAISDATLRLDANDLAMAAAGNQANGTLSSDGLSTTHSGATLLRAGAGGVSADGALVIANRQSASDTVTGTVPFGSSVLFNGGAVSGATVSASGNSQEGRATANGAADAISVGDGQSGAGIASYQSVDSQSQTAGRASGMIDLRSDALSSSQLTNSGNAASGVGTGNQVATTLTANPGMASPILGSAMASDAAGDDPVVDARYGILTNQSAAGLVKGRAGSDEGGPAFHISVSDVVTGSSVANDGNSLVGASYGNNADNDLSLEATAVAGIPTAAIADITDVQKVSGVVKAFAAGGDAVDLGAGLFGSSLSASNDSARAVAAGNLASDAMSVKAVSIDQLVSVPAAQPYASALIIPADGATHAAGFGIQTEQDFGTSAISAWQPGSVTALTIAGAIDASRVSVDSDLRSVAASGNSAADSLAMDTGDLASTAALNLVQSGNGSVSATLGAAGDQTGNRVTAARLDSSSLSVSHNEETATALGNDGSATLTVAANRISGIGASQAASGALDAGYGTTGAFVLAANQKLGAPDVAGGVQPSVAASVNDRSGAIVLGGATRSTLAVDGNDQRANALGNNGTNRLAVSAASPGDGGSAPSGLSSSQYGQAAIAATSTRTLLVPGTLVSSSAELSDNANIAYAAVNDVDNGLSVDGVDAGSGNLSSASSGEFGPPIASGDVALGNQQFAAGTLDAHAASELGAASQLTSSQLTFADNATVADAAANRALNAVSSGSLASSGASLANTQINSATVHASAATDLRFTGTAAEAALTDSTLTIDGNTNSATARGNVADNELSIIAGTDDAAASSLAQAGSSSPSIMAPGALLNQQANVAAVSADASANNVLAPLNGAVGGSRLIVTGNTSSATAFGNSATNMVTVSGLGAMPAAIVNMQTNTGSVSAVVTGATYRSLAGPIAGSTVSLSGNQIGAAATGNLATSAITTAR